MAAPGPVTLFGAFGEHLAEGTIDFDTDAIVAELVTSAYTPNTSTHDRRSDWSASALGTAFGYTSPGQTISVTVNRSGLVTTLDGADPSWTASGGSIVARYLVLYANVTRNGITDPAIGYVLLDSAPADVTIADGSTTSVAWHASGIATITT